MRGVMIVWAYLAIRPTYLLQFYSYDSLLVLLNIFSRNVEMPFFLMGRIRVAKVNTLYPVFMWFSSFLPLCGFAEGEIRRASLCSDLVHIIIYVSYHHAVGSMFTVIVVDEAILAVGRTDQLESIKGDACHCSVLRGGQGQGRIVLTTVYRPWY